jgi:hypothetical protein
MAHRTSAEQETGVTNLSRADRLAHLRLQATAFCIRLHDCVFPERGIYFLELWYDNEWTVDQRLELT